MKDKDLDFSSCILDLHYWFDDGTHTMDALLQNKCETKFLMIFQAVAKSCRAKIEIEIEPRIEGGLLNRYRIKEVNAPKNAKGKLPDSVKVALLTAVFLAPTTVVINGINEVVKGIVSERIKDPVKDNLEKEKLQLEIEKLKLEIEGLQEKAIEDRAQKAVNKLREQVAMEDFRRQLIKVNTNTKAINNRLRFYKLIVRYPKINNVSTQVLNAGFLEKTPEFSVGRQEFIGLVDDMSDALKRIDSLSAYLGDDHYLVRELRDELTKLLDSSKHNKH